MDIQSLIQIISIVISAGLVLYFDGFLFSGGKGWVKGLGNAFRSANKGFLYFFANIIAMIVAGYYLEKFIRWILLSFMKYFIPIILSCIALIYFYYLINYTKKGLKNLSVLIIILVIVILFFIFYKFF